MIDPITVEVIRAAMNAAAEEMKICMGCDFALMYFFRQHSA